MPCCEWVGSPLHSVAVSLCGPPHRHEEYGAILYMVHPGVKLKTLVCVAHINLWTRVRGKRRLEGVGGVVCKEVCA